MVRFVATLYSRQGRVVLDRGADAYYEGLIANAADDEFGVVGFFGMGAARDGFVAGGGEGRALGWALREAGGELFGDVGHQVYGDPEFMDGGTLVAGEFADSGGLIAGLDGNCNRDGAAENSTSGGFIEPRAFRLRIANRGRKQRET